MSKQIDNSKETESTSELVNRARTLIYAVVPASPNILYDAATTLSQILKAEPENEDAIALIREFRAKYPDFIANIQTVCSPQVNKTVAALLAQMTNAYYTRHYEETIRLCGDILAHDSTNAIAWEYLHKTDERLERSNKSDSCIPQNARNAYNNGLSAKRGELYEEAQKYFIAALDIARNEGIDWWDEPKDEIEEVEQYLSEKAYTEKGNELANRNKFTEALNKYNAAWNLKHFPRTKKRRDLLETVIQIYQIKTSQETLSSYLVRATAETKIKDISTSLIEKTIDLYQQLDMAQKYWPNSKELKELFKWFQAELPTIGEKLRDDEEILLYTIGHAATIKDNLHRINNVLQQIEAIHALFDINLESEEEMLLLLKNEINYLKHNQAFLEEANQAISQCETVEGETRSNQITTILGKLQNRPRLVVYEEYRDLLGTVIGELLRCCDQALAQDNLGKAQQYLDEAENAHLVIFSVDQVPSTETEEMQQCSEAVKLLKDRTKEQIAEKRKTLKFKYAQSIAKKQQYPEALYLLEELLTEDPENTIHYEFVITKYKELSELFLIEQNGKKFFRMQMWNEAKENLQQAINLGSADPEVEKFLRQVNSQTEGWPKLDFEQNINLLVQVGGVVSLFILTGFLIAANVLQ